MMLTRSQFRKLFNNIKCGLGDPDSPLWIPETLSNTKKSRHFVFISPILENDYPKFRVWCAKHCRGQVLCYSVDDANKEAWYGFTHKPDIVWFLLRWS
jgi:hypothetical protein